MKFKLFHKKTLWERLFFKRHRHRNEIVVRFLILLAIISLYFAYLSWQYGLSRGFTVLVITWSFFVLCTPIADAGFILDFPIRLLLKVKMIFSEIIVWFLAIFSNIVFLTFSPGLYEANLLTKIFKVILITPFPYWIIILLSGAGTFLSVAFGDELLDVIRHKDRNIFHKHHFKAKAITLAAVFIIIIIIYDILISRLGINEALAG